MNQFVGEKDFKKAKRVNSTYYVPAMWQGLHSSALRFMW